MPYLECKVYSDGSHYIAIPHTERKNKKRMKPAEESVVVDGVPTTKKAEFEKLYAARRGVPGCFGRRRSRTLIISAPSPTIQASSTRKVSGRSCPSRSII